MGLFTGMASFRSQPLRRRLAMASLATSAWDVAAVGGTVAAGAVVGGLASISPADGLLAAMAIVALVACLVAPLWTLPLAAAAISLVIPVQINKLAVGVIPLVIWLVRAPQQRPSMSTRLLAAGAGLWALAAYAAAPLHTRSGLTWSFACAGSLLLPMVYSLPSPGRHFRAAYSGFVTVLAAYGVAEKWILHFNPLYGHVLTSAQDPVLQVWSTYRATTLIGHPLINATIFGSTLILLLDDFLTGKGNRVYKLAMTAIVAGGLIATVSRGPTLAAMGGVALLLAYRQTSGPRANARRVILIVMLGLAVVVALPVFVSRDTSQEGTNSALQRSFLLQDTNLALSHSYLLGVGPGQAEQYREAQQLPRSNSPLESMYAQLLVELGVPGFLLLVGAVLSVILLGMRRADTRGAAIAVLVMFASLGTFDAVENRQNLMVVLGVLLCLASSASRGKSPDGAALVASAHGPPTPSAVGSSG